MAEALGVVASGIAIMQLVGVGQKFARELRRLSRQAGSPREVERSASQARLWWNLIGAADLAFKDHCERYGDDSPVADFIASNGIFDDIEKETAFIEEDIWDAIDRLKKLKKGRFAPLILIKWWYQKESILMPFPQMQLLQVCLSVLMSSFQMESCRLKEKEASSTDIERLRRENKYLRRMIKDGIRSIPKLAAEVEQINRRRPIDTHAPGVRKSTSIGLDTLIELGASMAQTGDIPQTPRASRAPSEAPLRQNRYSSSDTTSITAPRTAKHHVKRDPPPNHGEPRQIPPLRKTLRVDPDNATEATGIYVLSSEGTRIAVSAILLRHMNGNIISITEAGRLGLEVEEQAEDEVIWIALKGAEPKKTIGKVQMWWNGSETEVNPRKRSPIDCYVVEHCRPCLIFGKPFWDMTQDSYSGKLMYGNNDSR